MNQHFRAHVAMFSVALIYGITYFVAKSIIPKFIGPFGAIFIRVSLAAILFTIVHQFSNKEKVEKKDFSKLILTAFFGVTLNQLMFFKGLSITNPINASLIMTTSPILVMILSAFILKEKITWKKLLGITLGATGAILLISGKDFSFSSNTIWGDLAIFINSLSYGVYLILVKPLMKKYQALTVVRWTFTFGFIMIIPFGFQEVMDIPLSSLNMDVFWAMGFIVLFTSFSAYLLNAWALKIVNPSLVGFYIYLQPIITTLITLALGNEIDLVYTIFLSSLIFLGVYLVSKK